MAKSHKADRVAVRLPEANGRSMSTGRASHWKGGLFRGVIRNVTVPAVSNQRVYALSAGNALYMNDTSAAATTFFAFDLLNQRTKIRD